VKAIIDSKGRPVGWFDTDHVYRLNGVHLAFVRGEDVYDHGGAYIASFKDGFFWDLAGDAVAFVKGAHGGPSLVIPSAPPSLPALGIPPKPPSFPKPRSRAKLSRAWSKTTWTQLVSE